MKTEVDKLKSIHRELELITLQLRHATIINFDRERIKSGLDKLDIQLSNIGELTRKYDKNHKKDK
jgi:hypothetical protein